MLDDLEQTLRPYWKAADVKTAKAMRPVFVVGIAVALGLWFSADTPLWSFDTLPCIMWGGIAMFITWICFGMPETMSWTAPDELLEKIASLHFVSSAAEELRESLREKGSVSMGDVSQAFQTERAARRKLERLNQPGAKALLND